MCTPHFHKRDSPAPSKEALAACLAFLLLKAGSAFGQHHARIDLDPDQPGRCKFQSAPSPEQVLTVNPSKDTSWYCQTFLVLRTAGPPSCLCICQESIGTVLKHPLWGLQSLAWGPAFGLVPTPKWPVAIAWRIARRPCRPHRNTAQLFLRPIDDQL